ncbi:MAG: HEAT repeat domain-containing protein, partial [Pseudanabaena sp.]
MSHQCDHRPNSILITLREVRIMDSEMDQWLEMLRSPNVEDRLVAVKSLQHIGDEEIFTPLLEAVKDENPLVQKLAVTTL